MQQLLCDGQQCGEIIQDGTERIDVTLLPRQDEPSGEYLQGGRYNFHPTCFTAAGPVMPASGLSVLVSRIPGTTPPAAAETPVAPALPDPLAAPAL